MVDRVSLDYWSNLASVQQRFMLKEQGGSNGKQY